MLDLNSSEWAAWTQGVGTVAAVCVAIWVWAHGVRTQRRSELRAQASVVAAWVSEGNVVYTNASPLQVYDATILVEYALSGPDEAEQEEYLVATLPPTLGRAEPWVGDFDFKLDASRRPRLIEFNFRDAANGLWIRQQDGRLEPMYAPDTLAAKLSGRYRRLRLWWRRSKFGRITAILTE